MKYYYFILFLDFSFIFKFFYFIYGLNRISETPNIRVAADRINTNTSKYLDIRSVPTLFTDTI